MALYNIISPVIFPITYGYIMMISMIKIKLTYDDHKDLFDYIAKMADEITEFVRNLREKEKRKRAQNIRSERHYLFKKYNDKKKGLKKVAVIPQYKRTYSAELRYEKHRQRAKEKIKCACGNIVRRGYYSQHLKKPIHKRRLQEKNNAN